MNAALLPIFLRGAGALQLVIAVLNLCLVPLHAWFISVTLMIFGLMTWRFATELAAHTNTIGSWLAAGIGIFWAIQTVLQVAYYSSSDCRRQLGGTVVHVVLLVTYGGMAVTYLWAVFGTSGGQRR